MAAASGNLNKRLNRSKLPTFFELFFIYLVLLIFVVICVQNELILKISVFSQNFSKMNFSHHMEIQKGWIGPPTKVFKIFLEIYGVLIFYPHIYIQLWIITEVPDRVILNLEGILVDPLICRELSSEIFGIPQNYAYLDGFLMSFPP